MRELTKDKVELEAYLKEQGWLQPEEKVSHVEIPGAGNMNFTLRVKTGARSFIIKQSRDYVEKYPQVAAPAQRVLRESDFYKLISEKEGLQRMMPKLTGLDTVNNVIAMEDLGAGNDFTFLYQEGEVISENDLESTISFLTNLHKSFDAKSSSLVITNTEMRQLNHEHIFIYPYLKENGLNLDDVLMGLEEAAQSYKSDENLKAEVQKLGKMYLADGHKLLHGDYFPGSWLKTNDGIKIIDPEFCFFGPPEFDLAVMVAHLKMADQPQTVIDKALSLYRTHNAFDKSLQEKFTAIEILRRILGLAQLPLTVGLEKRKSLMAEARETLLTK